MAQFTKKAIVEAFLELLNENPFDKISVVEIADRCGINRNTFYYYYKDIYALVEELFYTETQKIINEKANYESWAEAFLQALQFTVTNKRAVYHIYHSVNRDQLEQYLYDVTLSNMTSFVRRQAGDLYVREEDIQAVSIFYSAALLGLMLRWLYDGMKQELEVYVQEMGRLMDDNIRYTLAKSDGRNTEFITPPPEELETPACG